MGYYNPHGSKGFEVKKLSDEDVEYYKYLKRLATAYALVGVIAGPLVGIFLIIMQRFFYGFLIFALSFMAILICSYYDLQAREIVRDE